MKAFPVQLDADTLTHASTYVRKKTPPDTSVMAEVDWGYLKLETALTILQALWVASGKNACSKPNHVNNFPKGNHSEWLQLT
jgi:hypothetical protein